MMTRLSMEIIIPGKPATKGSWRQIRGRLINDNENTKTWTEFAQLQARRAMSHWPAMSTKAINIDVVVGLERPKHHFIGKTGVIRQDAPLRPTGKRYDVDKILRAVLDAFTGIAYHDDSQVTAASIVKEFRNEAYTRIWITEV